MDQIRRLHDTLRRLSDQHERYVAVSEAALSTASLDEVVARILELLRQAVQYDSGAFYWWDAGRRVLRRSVHVGSQEQAQTAAIEVRLGDGLLGRAAADGRSAMQHGGAEAPHTIALPVLARGSLLGAFCIQRDQDAFDADDLAVVASFLPHVSVAIENARLLRQVRISEELYRSLFTASLDAVYMSTPSGLFLDINPAGIALFGAATSEDVLLADIGRDLYVDPAEREVFKLVMADQGFVRERQVRLKRLDGTHLTVLETATAVRDEHGTTIAYRGILRDVTERKKAEEALEYQALHDALTKLANRALLYDRLQHAIHAAQRHGASTALLLMDLDRFKDVNDTLGHAAGDFLLIEVARRLRSAVRTSETVARLGGDEFAVVLPGSDARGAQAAARRILEAVERPFVLVDQGIDVDVRGSVGIALYPTHGVDADELLRRADVAMYMAKRAGTGQVMYSAEQDQHSPSHLALAGDLRRALDSGRDLLLYYQPVVDVRSGEVAGVEALARWRHPQHALLAPDVFIPLAERTGLIRSLTDRVLAAAVSQCRAWLAEGLELPISVNLSMRDLQEQALPDIIAALLRQHGVPARLINLEITESVLMADPARVMAVLERLRALGLRVAIDDFGTGYASLRYLADLPVDTLKIDRGFVQRVVARPRHASIVRSTIDLAHELGLRVVAEGVEDEATWQLLANLGCDQAQGYLVGRPMPEAELRTSLGCAVLRAA